MNGNIFIYVHIYTKYFMKLKKARKTTSAGCWNKQNGIDYCIVI